MLAIDETFIAAVGNLYWYRYNAVYAVYTLIIRSTKRVELPLAQVQ